MILGFTGGGGWCSGRDGDFGRLGYIGGVCVRLSWRSWMGVGGVIVD